MELEELAEDDLWPRVPMIKAALNNHMRHMINISHKKEAACFIFYIKKIKRPHHIGVEYNIQGKHWRRFGLIKQMRNSF